MADTAQVIRDLLNSLPDDVTKGPQKSAGTQSVDSESTKVQVARDVSDPNLQSHENSVQDQEDGLLSNSQVESTSDQSVSQQGIDKDVLQRLTQAELATRPKKNGQGKESAQGNAQDNSETSDPLAVLMKAVNKEGGLEEIKKVPIVRKNKLSNEYQRILVNIFRENQVSEQDIVTLLLNLDEAVEAGQLNNSDLLEG